MDWDELDPKKKPQTRKNLEPMSIEDLRDYISLLEEEIVRARDMIENKQKGRSSAESLFKKG